MGLITNTQLNSIMDHLAQFYLRAKGTSGDDYGLGTDGVQVAVTNLLTDLYGLDNADALQSLAGAINALQADQTAPYIRSALMTTVSNLNQNLQAFRPVSTITSLDTFLTYMNTGSGGTWAALQNPAWYDMYSIFYSGQTMSVWNLFYEILLDATHTHGLGQIVHGSSFTAGDNVPAGYAGGFAELLVSSLAGSDTVTVTGTSYDPVSKASATGKTWTAAISADGTASLAVGTAPANSLIQAVSNISLGSGITAGTFTVQAARPSGRPSIP